MTVYLLCLSHLRGDGGVQLNLAYIETDDVIVIVPEGECTFCRALNRMSEGNAQ